MNIGCYLVTTSGEFKNAVIPDKLLVELVRNLRTKGKEVVHFKNESFDIEGVYIPAKGSKTAIILLPSVEVE